MGLNRRSEGSEDVAICHGGAAIDGTSGGRQRRPRSLFNAITTMNME
jgi:hypothetical protein